MTTKIFLMCAGKGVRWGIKVPKHIALVNGEENIKRTIRLINEFDKDIQTYVIVNEIHKSFFDTSLNIVVGNYKREIDRFRNAYPYMDNCERIIFLYGDVIYHQDDLNLILSKAEDCYCGRKDGNPLTKKKYGELFGVVIMDKDKFKSNVDDVADKFNKGIINVEIGWTVYYNQENQTFYELSHYTDDYDTYKEYQQLLKLYNN